MLIYFRTSQFSLYFKSFWKENINFLWSEICHYKCFLQPSRRKMSSSRKHQLKVKDKEAKLSNKELSSVTEAERNLLLPNVHYKRSLYMYIWCSVAEFDAVHRQRFTGGGRKRAAGGEGEVHGRDLSSRVHAQDHAGAAGVFSNEFSGINIFWIILPLWHFAVLCVFRSCAGRSTTRSTWSTRSDTTWRWKSINRTRR